MTTVLFYLVDLLSCVYAIRNLGGSGVRVMAVANMMLTIASAGHNVSLFGFETNFGNITFSMVMLCLSYGALKETVEEYRQLITCVVLAFTLRTLLVYAIDEWNTLSITVTFASFSAFYLSSALNARLIRIPGAVWKMKLLANVAAQAFDSMIFFPMAFGGLFLSPKLIEFMVCGFLLKSALNIIDTPLFCWCIKAESDGNGMRTA